MALFKKKKEQKQKGPIREWFDSVLFAVVAATLIRWAFLEAYTIPTGSMERSLLINDFLFVSKMHYGTRAPMTPLQVPLTHQKIWFTEMPSYSDAIELPYFRFPGFTHVKNGDVVVFNYPGCPERPDPYGGFDKYPVDLRTNYIKRCIGIAGDKVEIRDTQVFVNGEIFENPPGMQKWYTVESNTSINPNLWKKNDVTLRGSSSSDGKVYYAINATQSGIENLKGLDFITNIYPDVIKKNDSLTYYKTFPYAPDLVNWNRDNFGPITIPKKGMSVDMTDPLNIALYKGVITTFDHNDNAEYKDGKVYINGEPIVEYTFNQDYYFMMGDNRYESDDSRFWGFVPEDHIVGKAVFIWMSLDSEGTFLNKIRWNRLFSIIK